MSLLPHHSMKASFLQCSSLITVQLSHQYMTTGKTKVSRPRQDRSLTIHTLVSRKFEIAKHILLLAKPPAPSYLQVPRGRDVAGAGLVLRGGVLVYSATPSLIPQHFSFC